MPLFRDLAIDVGPCYYKANFQARNVAFPSRFYHLYGRQSQTMFTSRALVVTYLAALMSLPALASPADKSDRSFISSRAYGPGIVKARDCLSGDM